MKREVETGVMFIFRRSTSLTRRSVEMVSPRSVKTFSCCSKLFCFKYFLKTCHCSGKKKRAKERKFKTTFLALFETSKCNVLSSPVHQNAPQPHEAVPLSLGWTACCRWPTPAGSHSQDSSWNPSPQTDLPQPTPRKKKPSAFHPPVGNTNKQRMSYFQEELHHL